MNNVLALNDSTRGHVRLKLTFGNNAEPVQTWVHVTAGGEMLCSSQHQCQFAPGMNRVWAIVVRVPRVKLHGHGPWLKRKAIVLDDLSDTAGPQFVDRTFA
jgi:hypothetical protein